MMKSDKQRPLERLGLLVNQEPNILYSEFQSFCESRLTSTFSKEEVESLIENLTSFAILIHADLQHTDIHLSQLDELKSMFNSAKVNLPEKIEQLMRIKKDITLNSKLLSLEPVVTLTELDLATLYASVFAQEVLDD